MAKHLQSGKGQSSFTERERALFEFGRWLLGRLEDPSAPKAFRQWANAMIDRYLYLVFHPTPDRLRQSIRLRHFGKTEPLTEAGYRAHLGLEEGVHQPDRVPLVSLAHRRSWDPRLADLRAELYLFGQVTDLFPVDEVEKLVVLGQAPRFIVAEVTVESTDYTRSPCITLRLFHPELVWELKPILEMAYPEEVAQELTLDLSRRLPGRGEQSGRQRRRYMTPEKRIMYLTCWLVTKDGGGERTSYRAQRICEREFGHTFDPEDYKDQLPKILAEFEHDHEQKRVAALAQEAIPPVISLYGLPS